MTTPGPIGLTALYVASKLGVPVIGSFHTDLGSYARMLSGSRWLERWTRRYMRWPYRRCERIFVPSRATGAMLVDDRIDPAKLAVWRSCCERCAGENFSVSTPRERHPRPGA